MSMDDGIDFDDLARRISSTDDAVASDDGTARDEKPEEDIADLTARILSEDEKAAQSGDEEVGSADQGDESDEVSLEGSSRDDDAGDACEAAHDAFEAGARAAWGDAGAEEAVPDDTAAVDQEDEAAVADPGMSALSDQSSDEAAEAFDVAAPSGFGAWSATAEDDIVAADPDNGDASDEEYADAISDDQIAGEESAPASDMPDVGEVATDPLVLTPTMVAEGDGEALDEAAEQPLQHEIATEDTRFEADIASDEVDSDDNHETADLQDFDAPEVFPLGAAIDPEERRPRVALMGEFSAGKSTLSNLLLGARSLPVNVTATQLPPVWISFGDRAPYRVDLDGNEEPVDLNQLEDVPVEETSHIRIFRRSDILEICDLIDMPGISDPNMSSQVWQRMLPEADAVIWCTHATQAWRQSEAAVWSTLDPALQRKSLLLLTRMDKILTERDQGRVMRRVAKETEGLFRNQFGISLTQALAAGEDQEKWEASGGEDFAVALVELIREIAEDLRDPERRAADAARAASTSLTQRPRPMATMNDAGPVGDDPERDHRPEQGSVLPQRVRPKVSSREGKRGGQRPSESQSLNF